MFERKYHRVMPLTPCLRCGRLARGSYCPAHQPKRESRQTRGRGGGAAAAKFRDRVLNAAGHRCHRCGSRDGLQAHHVIPLREGGSNDPDTNGMALCRRCHPAAEREGRS